MKKLTVLALLLTVLAYGCETLDTDTKRGAAIGAVTGAAIGGIVGHQDDHHGGEGAAIGAAAGALTGGLIGNAMDKRAGSGSSYLSVVEIADMAQKGVPSNIIIDEIIRTRSRYNLTIEQIDYLRSKGVEGKVVDYMLTTM
ncbi:MAG: glycine zipper domain-containing protein [Candidatus Omnitrophota bacterium]